MFEFYNGQGKLYLNAHSLSLFPVTPCIYPHFAPNSVSACLKTNLYPWAWVSPALVDEGRAVKRNRFLNLEMRSRDAAK